MSQKSEILIIEDTESDAALLQRALRSAGVTNPIHVLSNGVDALAFLNSKQKAVEAGEPQLAAVFIDLKLPDKSGFDILKLMQGRPAFIETLRIVVSSINEMDHIRRSYSFGADSFIAKPMNKFDMQELIHSFPDHWSLVDSPLSHSNPEPVAPRPKDPYDEAVHVWTRNRELIQKLRETLEAVRTAIDDRDETLAIIETLTEEIRNKYPASNNPSKKPRNNLLL